MEANTHLLPIIESHSKEDPVDQEIGMVGLYIR
jgi:hypothetical protein